MVVKKGKLFIVSAPSGAGKTTLIKKVLDRFDSLSYSVSHTTRSPRAGEVDGRDYFFVSASDFERKIEENQLLEWAKVHDNYYGTSREFVERTLADGTSLLLDIDVQGADQIMASDLVPVTIFIMPPSFEELETRLRKRGTDSETVIEKRLKNARIEMEKKGSYRHVLVNDDLDEAIQALIKIFEKEIRG